MPDGNSAEGLVLGKGPGKGRKFDLSQLPQPPHRLQDSQYHPAQPLTGEEEQELRALGIEQDQEEEKEASSRQPKRQSARYKILSVASQKGYPLSQEEEDELKGLNREKESST